MSSGLMGTVSGSSVANVCTTGMFTIPLMKSVGYEPYFAGAVEAVASTGGRIMPPVMGAAAFIMAEFPGIPYIQVALAAVVPRCFIISPSWSGPYRSDPAGPERASRDRLPKVLPLLKRKGTS